MEREQIEFALLAKRLTRPTVRLRLRFDVAQHGADVNRLAVVAAFVPAKFLHAENFMQSDKNAKKFYSDLLAGATIQVPAKSIS